jgi:hypothetical protein
VNLCAYDRTNQLMKPLMSAPAAAPQTPPIQAGFKKLCHRSRLSFSARSSPFSHGELSVFVSSTTLPPEMLYAEKSKTYAGMPVVRGAKPRATGTH